MLTFLVAPRFPKESNSYITLSKLAPFAVVKHSHTQLRTLHVIQDADSGYRHTLKLLETTASFKLWLVHATIRAVPLVTREGLSVLYGSSKRRHQRRMIQRVFERYWSQPKVLDAFVCCFRLERMTRMFFRTSFDFSS